MTKKDVQAPKDNTFDYLRKVIIIGDSGVGKTNILLRYNENRFADNYLMTIGINYLYKIQNIDGVKIKIQIWDTAGQDKFKTITQSYYNGSNGVIVVYSVDCILSFMAVKGWVSELREKVNNDCQIILVGNKCDMIKRQVMMQQGQQLAKSLNIPFFECSAKSGQNIQKVFETLALRMKQKIINLSQQSKITPKYPPKQSKIYLSNNETKQFSSVIKKNKKCNC